MILNYHTELSKLFGLMPCFDSRAKKIQNPQYNFVYRKVKYAYQEWPHTEGIASSKAKMLRQIGTRLIKWSISKKTPQTIIENENPKGNRLETVSRTGGFNQVLGCTNIALAPKGSEQATKTRKLPLIVTTEHSCTNV